MSRRRAGRYDCSSTTVFSIFVLTLFKSIINKNGFLIYFFHPDFHKYDNEMRKEVKNAEKVKKMEKLF